MKFHHVSKMDCKHNDVQVFSNGHSECRLCGFVFSLSHQEAMKVNTERDRQLDALIGILTGYCKENPEVIDKFFSKGKQ